MPPGNFPPDFSPDLTPGPFHNGTRHDFSENYPYHSEYRGYSGWEATGQWSPPPAEDAYEYEYGVAAYERSFGESPYGDVGGRYSFGHPPYDGGSFQQQRETTGGENSSYGLSATGSEAFQPQLYGDGYGIPADSGTPQQQQQHQHQQDGTPPATSTSATLSSPAPGAAPANGAPLQLFIARSVQIGKSESGDSVAVDRDGVVRGSVVGRVDSALITRIASALRCTPGQPRPVGSEDGMLIQEQVP